MRSILLSFGLILVISEVVAQVQVHNNNNVQIGPLTTPAPNWTMFVNGTAHFNCGPATWGGFFFDTISYEDSTFNVPLQIWQYYTWQYPVIKPNVGNNMEIGTESIPLYNIYSTRVNYGAGGLLQMSDSRLKKDVEQVEAIDALELLLKLNAYKYQYTEEAYPNTPIKVREFLMAKEKKRIGFMADEVKDVYPEMVADPDSRGYLSLDYTMMIPVLVEAIQAQQKEIERLQKIVGE